MTVDRQLFWVSAENPSAMALLLVSNKSSIQNEFWGWLQSLLKPDPIHTGEKIGVDRYLSDLKSELSVTLPPLPNIPFFRPGQLPPVSGDGRTLLLVISGAVILCAEATSLDDIFRKAYIRYLTKMGMPPPSAQSIADVLYPSTPFAQNAEPAVGFPPDKISFANAKGEEAVEEEIKEKFTRPAKKLRRDGKHQEALNLLEKGLREHPDHPRLLCSMGAVHAAKENYVEARSWYKKAFFADSHSTVPLNSIGQTYLEEGKYTEARRAFETALDINPKDGYAHNNIGQTYFLERRYAEARKAFEETLAINPRNAVALTLNGRTYLAEKKYAEARMQFEKALPLDPDHRVAILTLIGQTCLAEGRYPEAKTRFEDVLAIDPSDEIARYLLAKLAHLQGNFAEAREHCIALIQRAKEMRPLFPYLLAACTTENDPIWDVLILHIGQPAVDRARAWSKNYRIFAPPREEERHFYGNALWYHSK